MGMNPRRFWAGFLIGLVLFLAVNLLAAHLLSDCGLPSVFGADACSDDIARAGFPVVFYEKGGFAEHSLLDKGSLGLDLLVGITFSTILGFFINRRKP